MNRNLRIRLWSGAAVLSVALVLLVASLLTTQSHPDTASAARDLGAKVEQRMSLLDGYVREALDADPAAWLRLEGLPEDMVVYRFHGDTLKSWTHQFPVRNDDIRSRTVVQRLGDGRGASASPLALLTSNWTFINFGPKWYLARAVREEDRTVIAGLEMVNELNAGSFNGINPRFDLGDNYTLQPLDGSIGAPVEVNGTPLFKITSENVSRPEGHDSVLSWLGILLFLAGILLVLSSHPTLPAAGVAIAVECLFLTGLYFYGRNLGGVSQLFSPLLYADGATLYSLGAVVLVNLLLSSVALSLYVARRAFLRLFQEMRSKVAKASVAAALVAGAVLVCIYIHFTFRSIVFNSGICLELYKVNLLDRYTAVVYASFVALALTVPMLLHLLSPLARDLVGLRYSVFSRTSRVVFAVLTAAYFVSVSSLLGFQKEQNRVEVWANRLAMDRDLSLEIQLRAAEPSIAGDAVIGTLSVLENSYEMIRGRLVNTYLGRLSQDYDISVVIAVPSPAMDALFNERIRGGVRLADNSHFFYSTGANGRARYTGLFTYYTPEYGASSVLVLVEPKSNREDRGYLSLLGVSEPGRVNLPSVYSYAKYVSHRLTLYKGDFAYPTLVSDRLGNLVTDHPDGHLVLEGYMHFVHNISDEEMIVVSRPETEVLNYVVEGVLFAIVAYLLVSLLGFRLRRRHARERHYYRTRISVVLYVSLTLTLVAMAAFSVYFVYRRNNADLQNIMTSRITSLQSMLQSSFRTLESGDDLRSQAAKTAVEDAGNDLKCDITLFTPDGRMVLSTTPEVYDRMVAGCRISEEAYYSIVLNHRRFSIRQERMGNRRYYSLYAPVINAAGEMVAIASTPYTDQSYEFENEALVHIISIITVFLLLLMLARVVTEEVVSRMFRPLSEMGRKMKVSDVDHLEYIVYDQEDELTSLVRAYNLMVHDLSDSTRQLAQAERDKAWSEMARQVAHEIKNPLTPIKLKIQMLLKMKQTGHPGWEEKFEEVSASVLEHIDLLAETATEFSTFAHLYTEDPVLIDLDALVREEVQLFDSRDDVTLTYYGLEGAEVMGPKPQLTRVLVNLITNAIQALEGREDGQVVVSLRNSTRDGFYDIVVEDNGPGVKEENRVRLFTPDFTTKSHGTGLGLAICRNIVDRCGGEIGYSKSFALGGACFTVRYPKLSK